MEDDPAANLLGRDVTVGFEYKGLISPWTQHTLRKGGVRVLFVPFARRRRRRTEGRRRRWAAARASRGSAVPPPPQVPDFLSLHSTGPLPLFPRARALIPFLGLLCLLICLLRGGRGEGAEEEAGQEGEQEEQPRQRRGGREEEEEEEARRQGQRQR
jgi:hypothetical protein